MENFLRESFQVEDGTIGFVDDKQCLELLLKEYYARTSTKYIAERMGKNFGNYSIENDKEIEKRRVRYTDNSQNNYFSIPFTGVPYLSVNGKKMACHLGQQKAPTVKLADRKKKFKGSKKMGCKSLILIRETVTFPDFKVSVNTSKRQKDALSRKLRGLLINEPQKIKIVKKIYVKLPKDDSHTNHPLSVISSTPEILNIGETMSDSTMEIETQGPPRKLKMSIFNTLSHNSVRYIVHCRHDDTAVHVHVTDGKNAWDKSVTEGYIPNKKEFMLKLRSAIEAGTVSLAITENKLELKFDSNAYGIELKPSLRIENTSIEQLLFAMADRVKDLEKRLTDTTNKLEEFGTSNAAGFFDAGPSKKSDVRKRPKQPGMSLVNPGSKKRKNAAGVQFS